MRLLIVEDDELQTQRYGDSIEQFNHEHGVEVRPEYRNNFEEGLKALLQDYDGAVIDLRLSGDNEAQGNLIVREIVNNKRFPVCVLTGYPQDLDGELQEYIGSSAPNLFFWVERRDRPFAEVLNRLKTVHESGVVDIVGPQGEIEKALHEIFWSHLAKTLSFWNKVDETNENRKKRLVRFILSLLLSKLETTVQGTLDDSYPDEMYVIPPFRDAWQTGDIVKRNENEDYFVIVTPACDLAQAKAKSIQVVEVESFKTGIMLDRLNSYKSLSKKLEEEANNEEATRLNKFNQDKAMSDLIKLAGNGYSNRYHFLPKCQSFPGGVINFQKVSSIQLKAFSQAYIKQGSITAGFLKDIVARFSGYYARQGQPDFECQRLIKELIE